MTFPDPLFHLAQLTEFEICETFADEHDTCCELDNTFIMVCDLDETLIGRSYVDAVITI